MMRLKQASPVKSDAKWSSPIFPRQAGRKAGYIAAPCQAGKKNGKRPFSCQSSSCKRKLSSRPPARDSQSATAYFNRALRVRGKSAAHVTLATIRKALSIHIFYPGMPEQSLSSFSDFMTIDLQADFLASRYEPLSIAFLIP